MTIFATLELQCAPGGSRRAAQILDDILAETSQRPGFLSIDLVRADGDRLLLIEQWESEEHDKAYREWRRSLPPNDEFQSLLVQPPVLTKYEHLSHVAPTDREALDRLHADRDEGGIR